MGDINLSDLIGIHKLSGVEYGNEEFEDCFGNKDTRGRVIFVLDGIKYVAVEDPNDGYRSCCKEIEITEEKIYNQFEPIEVFCKMMEDGGMYSNDVLEIYGMQTAKLVLRIGTESYNGYYPMFIFEYKPENMAVNQKY